MKTIGLLGAGIVAALGLRVLYLFVRYVLGSAGTARFHVESWALIFLALGFALRLARNREPAREALKPSTSPLWLWPVFCALALLVYWPALSVGFLSDDFVLVAHASDWGVGPLTPILFRPVPLFIWAVLLHAGAQASALHLLSLLLHGTNAYLTARVVEGWGQDRTWSLLAGLLMLTAPLAPEAVVWLSGVFDLLATTLVLACILIARRYDEGTRPATRVLFVALGIAAVASKETAAVAGGLVLLDGWARGAWPRRLLVDTGALIATVAVFGVVRLSAAFGMTSPPIDRFVLQRALFGTFGGLAVPWHVDVIDRVPWLPILGVAILLYLLLAFFLERDGSKQRTRLAMAAVFVALISIMPVFPVLFVAPDLQQSRYLYMPAVGWAALIATLASQQRSPLWHRVSLTVVGALVAIDSYGTLVHLGPWHEAAALRDTVERSALDTGMGKCSTITLSDLPDSVRGAYVFRNGASEAFARDLRLNAVPGTAGGPCSFRWSETRLSFVPFGTD